MSLSAPHLTTGHMVTASDWNTNVDALNSLPVSTDGLTWQGRILSAPTATAPFNQSYSANAFTPVINLNPLGGTHPLLSGLLIDPPLLGAAPTAVTAAATLVLRGAPVGAGLNYALLVTGNARSSFQGPILMNTNTNTGITFSDALTTGVVATTVGAYLGSAGANFALRATTDVPLLLGSNNVDQFRLTKDNLTIDFGPGDLEYLTFQSTSDIFHDFVNDTSRQSFGNLKKADAAAGGMAVAGYSETTTGLALNGNYTTGDTTKAVTSVGGVVITSKKLFGGTGAGDTMATNENLLVVRNSVNAQFIINADGDTFYNGSAPANYDRFDDIALSRSLDLTFRGPDLIDSEFDKFVQYNRSDLERAGIVTPGGFICMSKHTRLLNGAVWQLGTMIRELRREVAALKAVS